MYLCSVLCTCLWAEVAKTEKDLVIILQTCTRRSLAGIGPGHGQDSKRARLKGSSSLSYLAYPTTCLLWWETLPNPMLFCVLSALPPALEELSHKPFIPRYKVIYALQPWSPLVRFAFHERPNLKER